jgi:hypothetical protein
MRSPKCADVWALHRLWKYMRVTPLDLQDYDELVRLGTDAFGPNFEAYVNRDRRKKGKKGKK